MAIAASTIASLVIGTISVMSYISSMSTDSETYFTNVLESAMNEVSHDIANNSVKEEYTYEGTYMSKNKEQPYKLTINTTTGEVNLDYESTPGAKRFLRPSTYIPGVGQDMSNSDQHSESQSIGETKAEMQGKEYVESTDPYNPEEEGN